MCCIQIHVLSDVGLHCSIVEEYILSSGLPFITQYTHGERTKMSRLRAVWGILSVMLHQIQALIAPSSHLVMVYIIYIYIYIYIYMYVCMYMCVYIYIYTHTHTHMYV